MGRRWHVVFNPAQGLTGVLQQGHLIGRKNNGLNILGKAPVAGAGHANQHNGRARRADMAPDHGGDGGVGHVDHLPGL